MEIYASQPYGFKESPASRYYDYFQLNFNNNKYVWLFINSMHDEPVGYLLSEDREIINGGKGKRFYINFEPADLEGEYLGDICVDAI